MAASTAPIRPKDVRYMVGRFGRAMAAWDVSDYCAVRPLGMTLRHSMTAGFAYLKTTWTKLMWSRRVMPNRNPQTIQDLLASVVWETSASRWACYVNRPGATIHNAPLAMAANFNRARLAELLRASFTPT